MAEPNRKSQDYRRSRAYQRMIYLEVQVNIFPCLARADEKDLFRLSAGEMACNLAVTSEASS